MSDTPDIPALRTISAERLAVGDMYYGAVLDLADQRKGWAVIEQEGQEVADVTNYAGTNRVDVVVKTPEGILTLAMFNDSQVLIEFKGHPNAVTTPGPLTRRFDAPQIEIALSTLADLYENSDDNTGDYLSSIQQEVAELVRHAKADIDNPDA